MSKVKFKSVEPFFSKEKIGIKNNTVRFTDEGERFEKLERFEKGLEIEIVNPNTLEKFTRKIKDVSIYENIFIVSWEV